MFNTIRHPSNWKSLGFSVFEFLVESGKFGVIENLQEFILPMRLSLGDEQSERANFLTHIPLSEYDWIMYATGYCLIWRCFITTTSHIILSVPPFPPLPVAALQPHPSY